MDLCIGLLDSGLAVRSSHFNELIFICTLFDFFVQKHTVHVRVSTYAWVKSLYDLTILKDLIRLTETNFQTK